jgi:hypothetical protein
MSAYLDWLNTFAIDDGYRFHRPSSVEVWNAALTHAAEICKVRAEMEIGKGPLTTTYKAERSMAINDCAEAIERARDE